MRRLLLPLSLLAALWMGCADNNPSEDASEDAGAHADAAPHSDASNADALAPDAPSADAQPNPDASLDAGSMDAENADATANPDAAPVNLTCDPATPLVSTADFDLRPYFLSNGTQAALAFQRESRNPHTVQVMSGDGVTFGSPITALTGMYSSLFAENVSMARDGRVVVLGGTSGSVARNILAADGTTLGTQETYTGGADFCIGAVASSRTELLMVSGTLFDTNGLSYELATGLDFGNPQPVGPRLRSDACHFLLDENGDGAAIDVDADNHLSARAFRAGRPAGMATTATVTGNLLTVRAAVLAPGGDPIAFVPLDQTLYALPFTWDAAGQRITAGTMEEVSPHPDSSDRVGAAIDPQGRITVLWFASNHVFVRRKLGGVWQPRQDLGLQGGGFHPSIAIRADGRVAIAYLERTAREAVRVADADSAVFGDAAYVSSASSSDPTLLWLSDGRLRVAWDENGDILGTFCQ